MVRSGAIFDPSTMVEVHMTILHKITDSGLVVFRKEEFLTYTVLKRDHLRIIPVKFH